MEGKSIFNDSQADMVRLLVRGMDLRGRTCLVLTPYRAQANRLRDLSAGNVQVATVDASQGQEADRLARQRGLRKVKNDCGK